MFFPTDKTDIFFDLFCWLIESLISEYSRILQITNKWKLRWWLLFVAIQDIIELKCSNKKLLIENKW